MTTGTIGRLLRLAGVLALAGFTVSCAGRQDPSVLTPAGYGKDPVSRAARLTSYCDRLAKKGEMVTALGLCARAHEINPDDPEILMKIAALLKAMDRPEAAAQTYGALLESHPGHHEARYSLGKLYMENGETDLAAVQFNHAMLTDPKDPRPYNALGILRDQAGDHEAAQALYRMALQNDPANVSVRNNLGLSLALNGKRDEAIDVLAQLAVDPEAAQSAEQTVLRNLEAAYAARAVMPQAGEDLLDTPAAMVVPAAPMTSVPLEEPQANPAAVKAADEETPPPAPAEGAPTPLFIPRGTSASEPGQTSALPVKPVVGNAQNSLIMSTAALLMQPPAWADFEPGLLIDDTPPPPAQESVPEAPGDEMGDVSEAAPVVEPQESIPEESVSPGSVSQASEPMEEETQQTVPHEAEPLPTDTLYFDRVEADPINVGGQTGDYELAMLMVYSDGAAV